ncbi:MAG: hypothetical protein ACFB0B_04290 [Thermonemataceae bacterium]
MTQLIISLLLWLGTPEAQVTFILLIRLSALSTQDIGDMGWGDNGKAQSHQSTTLVGESDWDTAG